MWDVEADLAYRRELWAAVPLASRATTAILHLPKQPHQFGAVALHALLPQAVAYAASGLAAAAWPDGRALPEGRAADHHQRQHGARRRPPARHTRRAAAAAAAGTAATSPGAIERQLGWELRAAVPADGPAEWPAGPGLMSI